MKKLLILTNKGDSTKEWFQYLHSQLIPFFEIVVVENSIGNSISKSKILDLILSLETKYSLSGNFTFEKYDIDVVESSSIYTINPEIILDLCVYNVQNLLSSIKAPIITINYRGQKLGVNPYIGLYEHLYTEATINIDLVLESDNKTYCIDQGRYSGHWSSLKSSTLIYYSIASLIRKNMNKSLDYSLLTPYDTCLIAGNAVSIIDSLRYAYSTTKNILLKVKDVLGNKLFKTSGGQEWTVFIGKGSFFESKLKELTPFIYPKGEFWADPFLFNHSGDLYLFFERFPYNTNKGVISCTKILNGKPTEVIDVLDKPYHLSYPNIFVEDGEIFMIPECSAAKHLEVYRCVDFPAKWELYSTALEGESVADSIYYRDKNGERWLLTSKESPKVVSHCNELWAYRIDSLKFNKVESHQMNPVVIDASVARNGGTIFEDKGKIYRASQDNSCEMYGKGICISEIIDLSIDSYSEVLVKRIDANNISNVIGMHHMDQIKDYFVIDGRFK